MYQQVIIDHARERHGFGLDSPAGARIGESHQVNPVCGDEIRLRVALDGERIAGVTWEGHGCSISQASVSVLHDLIEGTTLDEASELSSAFRALMDLRGDPPDPEIDDMLGDGSAFVGVGRYPARIKCALLGWMALKDALIQAQKETR
ncbi:MAG: SUF system NifU family Fe-S cluster assembly protein [Demequinaceae bacterium]|nr:SUF system NifU family Fe-S cluster assembly protein [Demequinaceae bacterium]